MSEYSQLNRKHFLTTAGLGALALGPFGATRAGAVPAEAGKPDYGLKLGVASYSLRNFNLDEALKITQQLRVKYITLKSMHLELNTSTAERRAAAQKVADAGIQLMGCGVVYMKKDEASIRQAFEYARDARMPVIVAAPSIDAMPLVDKMVKEFDIRVAIHNHGPGDQLYPSPLDAYRIASQYDKRIGVCIDFGHSVRNGDDEVDIILKTRDRLYDVHVKDVTKRAKDGKTVAIGQGVIDHGRILKTLLDIKYQDHVALEYEANASEPYPGMNESFAYLRGVLEGLHTQK